MQIEGEGTNVRPQLPTPITCDLCAATWQPRSGFVAARKESERVWHCFDCFQPASPVGNSSR